jgi:hypothetical protein
MLPFVLVVFRALPKITGGNMRHGCDTNDSLAQHATTIFFPHFVGDARPR